MTDVFLSHANSDRDLARVYVECLEQEGLSVFYDFEVLPGASYRNQIDERLSSAKCVLALFTPNSVRSDWFRSEADEAQSAKKLIPVRAADVQIPLGFRQIQFAELAGWNGDIEHREWRRLLATIRNFVESAPLSATENAPGDAVAVADDRRYRNFLRAGFRRVFIAHASADKPLIRPVIEVLIEQGFNLWIDKPQAIGLAPHYEQRVLTDRIHSGSDWRETIRRAIKRANIVLAFWSKDAVVGRREQFHYEVYLAMMQSKLHQCRIDDISVEQIGMPYTFDQIADLSHFEPGRFSVELDFLMEDLARSRWL